MPEELKYRRLLELGGTEEIDPTHVAIQGLDSVLVELRNMAEAQQRSQQMLYEAVTRVVEAIEEKRLKSADLSPLVDAVKSLNVTRSNTVPAEYQFSGERDPRTGLIKLDTLRFSVVPKGVH